MHYVGCSGWNYASWRGRFYPRSLPSSEWLRYYAERFETVEVNNSFYRLPERSTFADWRKQVPASFTFAVKGSRYLTHMKRLNDPDEPIDRLFTRIAGLGRKYGPVLYQLPGTLKRDLPRLDRFLRALPRSRKDRPLHVVEFRDPSWYVRDTFDLLTERHVALCLHDKFGSEVSAPFIGPFVYVRFHGTSGRYHGSYSRRQLDRWARMLAAQSRDNRRVYAYFNNDPGAVATANATTLRDLLDRFA